MGIRRGQGKSKKSDRPSDAPAVDRADIARRTANVRSRFDSTRRAPGAGGGRTAGPASPSPGT